MWFSTLFASTFLSQLCPGPTGTLQATSGHSWHIAEGKEYSPKFIWMEEKQEHIWAHAVTHQYSVQFLWALEHLRDHSALLQAQLEFMMPLMCL